MMNDEGRMTPPLTPPHFEKHKMERGIIIARVLVLVSLGAVVFGYASIVFWSVPNAEAIALSAMPRPYVYRTLMPSLAQGLVRLGLRADAAIVALLFLAAIGLVYAIKFLSETFKR